MTCSGARRSSSPMASVTRGSTASRPTPTASSPTSTCRRRARASLTTRPPPRRPSTSAPSSTRTSPTIATATASRPPSPAARRSRAPPPRPLSGTRPSPTRPTRTRAAAWSTFTTTRPSRNERRAERATRALSQIGRALSSKHVLSAERMRSALSEREAAGCAVGGTAEGSFAECARVRRTCRCPFKCTTACASRGVPQTHPPHYRAVETVPYGEPYRVSVLS
mmetsp:Transcript_979/g.2504  ORF Transcript_979/g.2504 Transcript_979/m.2504 type:complete len:223 (+) Transcript_979:746-1414(+)